MPPIGAAPDAPRIAHLDGWRLQRIRGVLGAMKGRASVPDYLAAVRAGPARGDVFAALAAYFAARVEKLDVAGRPIAMAQHLAQLRFFELDLDDSPDAEPACPSAKKPN
jgi:hypothetical protein